MTALLPARRRAEAFADALDALLEDHGSPPARDEADRSRDDVRFEPLLDLVAELVTTAGLSADLRPRESFSTDLRERLMSAADTELVATDARLLLPGTGRHHGPRRQGRLTAAVAAVAVVAGTAGIATASSDSVPGQSLYAVKLGVEQARSALSFGDAAQGRDDLRQARARLDEVSRMIDGSGDPTRLPQTMGAFTDQADQGSQLLFRAYQSNDDRSSVQAVRDFAGTAMGRLDDIAATAPEDLRTSLAQAAQLVAAVDQQAVTLCVSCGPRDALSTPDDLRLASAPLPALLGLGQATTAAQASATAGTAQRRVAKGERNGSRSTKEATKAPAVTLPGVGGALTSGADGGTVGASGGSADGSSGGALGKVVDPITGAVNKATGGSGRKPHGAVGKVTKGVTKGLDDTVDGLDGLLGDVLGGLGGTSRSGQGNPGK